MPQPMPIKDETEDVFQVRCMADPVMVEDFPDEGARAGACALQWEANEPVPEPEPEPEPVPVADPVPELGRKPSRWFSTGFIGGGVASVDAGKHTLHDAVMIRPGEALGHDLWIDQDFCASVAAMANANPEKGIKARFGHPNMCSDAFGTFLGRWKNIRMTEGFKVIGDLHLSSTASESPKGDLRKYVEQMATNEPDHFGASIVFSQDVEACNAFIKEFTGADGFRSPDPANVKNLPHARCSELHAADLVDDPAATDGMFSGIAGTGLAAQVTEWLDLNPAVLKALTDDPGMVDLLERYADQLGPFLSRYTAGRKGFEGHEMHPATCKSCGHKFDYSAQPEIRMGAVACPGCGEACGQDCIDSNNLPNAADAAKVEQASSDETAETVKALQAKVDLTGAELVKAESEAGAAKAERDTAVQGLATAGAEIVELNARLGALRTELEAAKAQAVEAQKAKAESDAKLAAMMSGAAVVSAGAAEDQDGVQGSMWDRARKSKKKA